MTKPIRPAQIRLESSTIGLDRDAPGADPLGLMAGSMAHDLNNILQIVSGNLSLMAREELSQQARRRVDNSMAALRSGAELTANVLDYCRQREAVGSFDTLTGPRHLVSMHPVLADAAGDGVEVVLNAPADVWAFRTNVHRLQNALVNLIINARDAMAGRGRLLVNVRNVVCPLQGERVWLTVADEGPGISPEILEQVFAPFYTTKPHGTGLGLAIVAEFARASRADVAIDSREGFGTGVTIEFPRGL